MTPLLVAVPLGGDAAAWFTGRAEGHATLGRAGNLSHRRPHLPAELAATRRAVARATGTPPPHLMRQVHGGRIAVVTARTPTGAQFDGVDGLVTALVDRPLAVETADCVPLLLAAPGRAVAAVHVGRRGLLAGIVERALAVLAELGVDTTALEAVIGPSIGGCCYELPEPIVSEVSDRYPEARATTSWGSPAVDLAAAVVGILRRAGVPRITGPLACTACDPRWFSHRRDPSSGRGWGLIVRRGG